MPATAWTTYAATVATARAGPADYIFYIGADETLWFCTINKTNPRGMARYPSQVAVGGTQPISLPADKHCGFAAGIGPNNNVHLVYTVAAPANPGIKFLAEAVFDGTNWNIGTLPQYQYGAHQHATLDITSANYTDLCVYYTTPNNDIATLWMNTTNLWQGQILQP